MRIEFDVDILIDRPPEEVFGFVTDPSRLSEWDTRVVEARAADGEPLREGSRIREVRKLGRKRLEQTVLVSDLEPARRFGLRIEEGPVPVHGDLRFEPDGEGTLVRLHAHGSVPGPQWLGPLFIAMARRQMKSQYDRLKRVLESGLPGGAGSRATGRGMHRAVREVPGARRRG